MLRRDLLAALVLSAAVLAAVFVLQHTLKPQPVQPPGENVAPHQPAPATAADAGPFPAPGCAGVQVRFLEAQTGAPVQGAAALDAFQSGAWTRVANLDAPDEAGLLRVSSAPAEQDLRLCLRSPEHVPWRSRAFRLAMGQVLDLGTVALERAWPVNLTMDRGRETGAFACAFERYWPPPELDGHELHENTAGYGRERFSAGTWLARARDENGREVQLLFDVAPGCENRVVLPIRFEGHGTLSVASHVPRNGEYVLWRHTHSNGWQVLETVPARNNQTWTDLPHGRYRVEARDTNGKSRFARPVEVELGSTPQIFTVPGAPAEPRTVRVFVARGARPAAGRRVWVEDDAGAIATGVSGADGWAEVALTSCPVRCGAAWQGSRPLLVAPGNRPVATGPVVLELEPAGYVPLDISGHLVCEQFAAEPPAAAGGAQEDNKPQDPPGPAPKDPRDRPLDGLKIRLPAPAPKSPTRLAALPVRFRVDLSADWTFRLYEPTGRLVYERKATSQPGLERLETLFVPPGEYVLLVASARNGVFMTRRLRAGTNTQPQPGPIVPVLLIRHNLVPDPDTAWALSTNNIRGPHAQLQLPRRRAGTLFVSPGDYSFVQQTRRVQRQFRLTVAPDDLHVSLQAQRLESADRAPTIAGPAAYATIRVQPPHDAPVSQLFVDGAELADRPGEPAFLRTDQPFELLRVPVRHGRLTIAVEGCERVVLKASGWGMNQRPPVSLKLAAGPVFLPLADAGLAPGDYYAAVVAERNGGPLSHRVVRNNGQPGLLVWPGRAGAVELVVQLPGGHINFRAEVHEHALAIARR